MTSKKYSIAFFGSSLVSAYWNGAATYYRGMIKALHNLGHQTTFFEPDAFERQQHRDMDDPDWANVRVYKNSEQHVMKVLEECADFDIVVKASGVGVFDTLLEREVLNNRQPNQRIIFWDVDAPETLSTMNNEAENELRDLIPNYDLVLTYGGGQPVIDAYEELGARKCVPINNAVDVDTHFPVEKEDKFKADLSFLGNRLPDRERRMENFFFSVAKSMPNKKFILGGSGWNTKELPGNVKYIGHVYTKDHNAFNRSPMAVLNINRNSMAEMGFSPATRVFEAAGAGACLITDEFKGIELFLEPGKEVLVAKNGEDVKNLIEDLTPEKAAEIGQAALKRVKAEHTYQHRAKQLTEVLDQTFSTQKAVSA